MGSSWHDSGGITWILILGCHDDITSEVVFDGFLARNYRLLLVLPVVWSYQALLYQHARGRESAT